MKRGTMALIIALCLLSVVLIPVAFSGVVSSVTSSSNLISFVPVSNTGGIVVDNEDMVVNKGEPIVDDKEVPHSAYNITHEDGGSSVAPPLSEFSFELTIPSGKEFCIFVDKELLTDLNFTLTYDDVDGNEQTYSTNSNSIWSSQGYYSSNYLDGDNLVPQANLKSDMFMEASGDVLIEVQGYRVFEMWELKMTIILK